MTLSLTEQLRRDIADVRGASDKDAKRWMMSLVGLFLPAKRAYGRNGAHAMERRRKQIAKGMLRATR